MPELAIIVPIWKEKRHILEQNLRVWKGYNVYWILNFQDIDTVCLAYEMGANIIISYSKNHLKGNMINTAMRKIQEKYVCVFDVDDFPSKGYVEYGLRQLKKHGGLVTGLRTMHNKEQNWITRWQELEQSLWNYVLEKMLQIKTGGWFPLLGSGFFIKREDMPKIWEGTTTEDADISIQLMQKKIRMRIFHKYFYAECPNHIIPMLNQRARWNKGILQVLFHYPKLYWENRLLFYAYCWILYSAVFTLIKLAKYPVLFFIPFPLNIFLLFIFLSEEFELRHWDIVESQGLTARTLTYSMICLILLNIAVPFIGMYEFIFRKEHWYCTPKQGIKVLEIK